MNGRGPVSVSQVASGTPKKLCRLFGKPVWTEPDVSKLMNGRHTGFSVDRLLTLLNALDVDVDIVVRPKPSSRTVRAGVVRVTETSGAVG